MQIADLIVRFEYHIKKTKECINKDISDYFVFNTLAMECFQTVNSIIEIGEWLVTEKRLGFPETYREIFEILYHNQIIDKESYDKIKRLIFLRNLISHEYYKISESELSEMAKLLIEIEDFSNKIKFIIR